MSNPIRLTGVLALAISLGACDSAGPVPAASKVQLSLATRAVAVAAPSSPLLSGTPITYNDGTNTLIIDTAQMVVKRVELKRSEYPNQCDSTATEDQCEELKSGPYLLDLPLDAGATPVVSVNVLPGTYDELEFKIHKPSHDSANAAFLAAHPEFNGVSIRVVGSWNGTAFTYVSSLDAEQEKAITPPLVVTTAGSADFTLFIDIGTWFRASDTSLIDPSTANAGGANEGVVAQNIERSIETFEDENHDGHDDHGPGGH